MPEEFASIVADLLLTEVIFRIGVPLQIYTHRERNYESDGMVERLNRTLEAMLPKFVQENQRI